jgi:hypothetical protein
MARRSRKGIGGPKTEAGKAAVRLNPLKHGVLAQTPVLPLVEDPEDWERLKAAVREFYDVHGEFLETKADRIAGLMWRLKRCERYETESIITYLQEVPRDWAAARRARGLPVPDEVTTEMVEEMDRMLMARLLPSEDQLEKIGRYENRFHKHLLQAMHQMLVLKGFKLKGPGTPSGTPVLDPPGVPLSENQAPWVPGSKRRPRLPSGPEVVDGE